MISPAYFETAADGSFTIDVAMFQARKALTR